jgi:hypothetical protein
MKSDLAGCNCSHRDDEDDVLEPQYYKIASDSRQHRFNERIRNKSCRGGESEFAGMLRHDFGVGKSRCHYHNAFPNIGGKIVIPTQIAEFL